MLDLKTGHSSGCTLNRVRCPALVCFWTGMIFMTSSFNEGPRKLSTIWYSLTGRENR